MFSYDRFMRTAEWVIVMAPMAVDAVPAGLKERHADTLDAEALWNVHMEQKRQTMTMPMPDEEDGDSESESNGDESGSASVGPSSNDEEEEEEEAQQSPAVTSAPSAAQTTSANIGGSSSTSMETSTSSSRRTTSSADMTTSTSSRAGASPSSTGLSAGNPQYDTTAQSASFTPTEAAQIGEDADHIKMEFGISAGVVGAFILLGFAIFWYLRKKKGKAQLWSSVKKPFQSTRSRSADDSFGPDQGPNSQAPPMVSLPVPTMPPPAIVISEKRISNTPSVVSPSPSEVERFNSLRRKYTISRSMPEGRQTPAPSYRRESASSVRSSASVRSLGTNGLPRGPKLPVVPAAGFSDPFSDDKEKKDPFADPSPDYTTAPAPLRFPVKSAGTQRISRLDSTGEVLTLTDPRVSDNRRLTVANRSVRDSIPSPPPVPKKKFSGQPEPLRLNNRIPNTPLQSRFSWTTKDEGSTPGFQKKRESAVTVSTEGAPKHRNVKSWVNHQTKRIERHPVEDDVHTPRYAKSERDLYDRRSLNSGMDTRRTEYDYDSDY